MRNRTPDGKDRNLKFRQWLLAWYDVHQRDLPWRKNQDPYRVWLSEIMLQQTRVAAVIEHYRQFLQRFPTLQKLASAREASVLAIWSGLGYYRRARMLHAAAKQVVKEHAGVFPSTSQRLKNLPGIGRYTAAAIASIAFGEPVAVVDGNVERVLERVAGKVLTRDECWEMAEVLLDRARPGDFNQAMMELGATVCLPRQPICLACPVFDLCFTHGELAKSATKSRQNKREICYALDCRNGSVFLVKRSQNASLMAGMWELPEIASAATHTDGYIKLKHSITVTDYSVWVSREPVSDRLAGEWIARKQLTKLPLTGLARKILRAAEII